MKPSSVATRRAAGRPGAIDDRVLDVLREIRDRLAVLDEIRDELHGLRADYAVKPERASRRALLAAVASSVADRAFTARELLAHADVDPGLSAAFTAAHIATARHLGKALRVIESRTIDGCRLARLAVERDGIVWRVFRD